MSNNEDISKGAVGWITFAGFMMVIGGGFAIFGGNALARTVGVIAAAVSALGAFTTIQLQPVWNTIIIAVDIAIIWALTTHGRDAKKLDDYDA